MDGGKIFIYTFPLSLGKGRFSGGFGLTHNLTHTAKEADGNSGADRTEKIIFREQKGPETAERQRFLDFQSVGKDEVSGSNPDSSSTKSGLFCGKGRILLQFWHIFGRLNLDAFALTT